MGLDFDKSGAHWSYGGFNSFRVRLAVEAGIDLNLMKGFYGRISWDTINDPIKPFLNHSDCEGELSPQECLQIAPRLKELVASWDDDDYDKQKALVLAEDMIACGQAGESLEFC